MDFFIHQMIKIRLSCALSSGGWFGGCFFRRCRTIYFIRFNFFKEFLQFPFLPYFLKPPHGKPPLFEIWLLQPTQISAFDFVASPQTVYNTRGRLSETVRQHRDIQLHPEWLGTLLLSPIESFPVVTPSDIPSA